MAANWIAISGRLQSTKDELKHIPVEPAGGPGASGQPFTIARSSVCFQNGTVTFDAYLEAEDARCQLGLNAGLPRELFVGLNVGSAAYGAAALSSGTWQPITSAGFGDRPPIRTWIPTKIKVHGSLVQLFVDDVKVCEFIQTIQRSQLAFLFQSSKPITVRNVRVNSVKPKVFVVMQFTDEFNALYKEVIRPTCEDFDFDVVRADETYASGLIIQDITRSIQDASLIIAEITPDNPNVFYELGYAHGAGKSTILLCDTRRGKLPFDVSGFRTLFYDNTIAGKTDIETKLRKHLENLAV